MISWSRAIRSDLVIEPFAWPGHDADRPPNYGGEQCH
jgi:hypothetical protein